MSFSVNRQYVGWGSSAAPVGDQLWFDWKTFMKGSGGSSDWTVIASGDGLSAFSTTTDVISQAAIGAGGMANPSSWFIIREPDNGVGKPRREILVYRTAAISSINQSDFRHMWYSLQGFNMSAGWAGNAVSATNPPVAYDLLPANGTANAIFKSSTNYTIATMIGNKTYIDTTRTNNGNNYGLLNDVANPRYAHFYKSDSAPWTYYAFSNTCLSDGKRLFGFMALDKRTEFSDYTPDVLDDGVFIWRGLNGSPQNLQQGMFWGVGTFFDSMLVGWSTKRDTLTFQSAPTSWTENNCQSNYGLFNAYRSSDSPWIAGDVQVMSNNPVFAMYYYEGQNYYHLITGTNASQPMPTESTFSNFAGRSQLFCVGFPYHTSWDIITSSQTWLYPYYDATKSWAAILWNGSVIAG
jgi:hypothetical protein